MAIVSDSLSAYAKSSKEEVFQKLQTSESGLSPEEVRKRIKQYGPNEIHKRQINFLAILLRQITSNPLIIVLATATFIAFLLGQHMSSYYIFGMILASVLLGFWNEYSAARVIDNLLKRISPTILVVRAGEKVEIPVRDLTIGDSIIVSQGTIIPADIRFIETKNIEVDQAALTGESKTKFKTEGVVDASDFKQGDYTNIGFMGTNVVSGWGKALVLAIGSQTQYGKIAKSTTYIRPITDFQKGLAKFGNLIVRIILLLTVGIFVINSFLGHPLLESLLFSLAIAVGLTPELLPVIVTISLAHGAGKLAKKHVVAKQLIGIENLGNMDLLCTDKTGTLTEGKLQVIDIADKNSKASDTVFLYALLCNDAIVHHKIIGDSINTALWDHALNKKFLVSKEYTKVDEEPFDYNRRAMFTVIEHSGETLLLVKGAPEYILEHAASFAQKKTLEKKFLELNHTGYRMIAVAVKKIAKKKSYSWDDVHALDFIGYITFQDLPKKTVHDALLRLKKLNVMVKIITGDNEIVAQKTAQDVGLLVDKTLTGEEIESMKEEEFEGLIEQTTIFARINPQQKLKIIQAFQAHGHTVGYMGDGINDIPSLHAADVGISVNTAVDVAKESASIVLLRKSLSVLADGIVEGRKTFSNTIKYILMATSSNFGNMFSAAGSSFFLPFLPMTPVQILLTNGLYDLSQTTIPSDNVDEESLVKPRHWNINFIRNYMIFFGPLSSIFDFLTFGVMLFIFHAQGALFQTGWFIESVATEILVIFVIRTARTPFWKSRPSIWLLSAAVGMVLVGVVLPFTPFAKALGFVTPPPLYFAILVVLIATYLLLVETVKSIFLKKFIL